MAKEYGPLTPAASNGTNYADLKSQADAQQRVNAVFHDKRSGDPRYAFNKPTKSYGAIADERARGKK